MLSIFLILFHMLMTTKKKGGGSSDVNSQTALRNSIKLVCIYIYIYIYIYNILSYNIYIYYNI